MTRPTDKEIEQLIGQLIDRRVPQRTRWPGMTYEQGVRNTLEWVLGEDINPLDNDCHGNEVLDQ